MPDAGKNAIRSWPGDGGTVNFVLDFPILSDSHLEVRLSGVLKTIVTDYSINSPQTLVTFVVAPPATGGNDVVFTRATPHPTPLVVFVDGATIPAAQLNQVLKQGLYYTEEVEDLT